MTGLDFRKDKLLEIAVCIFSSNDLKFQALKSIQVIITNDNLEPVDEGIHYIIQTEKHILDR